MYNNGSQNLEKFSPENDTQIEKNLRRVLIVSPDKAFNSTISSGIEVNFKFYQVRNILEATEVIHIVRPHAIIFQTSALTILEKSLIKGPLFSSLPLIGIYNEEEECFDLSLDLKIPFKENKRLFQLDGFLDYLNTKILSLDEKNQFYIFSNEEEKKRFLEINVFKLIENKIPTLIISSKTGDSFFSKFNIENFPIHYLQIKPSLIEKFSLMEEPKPILDEIENLVREDLNKINLIFDDPFLLIDPKNQKQSLAKMMSLSNLFDSHFASKTFLTVKSNNPRENTFILKLAKLFIP